MPTLTDPDPNEAYDVEPADYPAGWFTIRCNGIPVWYTPRREAADRYATDAEVRARLVTRKAYER